MKSTKDCVAVTRCRLPLGVLLSAVLTLFLGLTLTEPAFAYHFPWDQGHDTTTPPPPPDEGPCEGPLCDPCSGNSTGSPVYVPTGHLVWTESDIQLAGRPNLGVSRTYNSKDPQSGIFGNGWSSGCQAALFKTTKYDLVGEDYQERTEYILRVANGKRYVFVKSGGTGKVSAPAGRFEKIEELSDNRLALIALDGSRQIFGANGLLIQKLDQLGNAVHYTYGSSAQLTRLADDNGRHLDFSYGASGRVEQIEDTSGREWRYEYDASGNLVAFIDPLGGRKEYTYQASTLAGDGFTYQQLARITEPSGVVELAVSYTGDRVRSYSEGANTFTYTYNTTTRRAEKVDSLGRRWIFDYNTDGQITRRTDPSGAVVGLQFDANGNEISRTDALGSIWRRTYDALGRITSRSDPLNNTTVLTYPDDKPWPLNVTSPTGRQTRFTYTVSGLPLTVTDPAGHQTVFTWNAKGDLLTLVRPNAQTVQRTYDARGLLVSETDGLGRRTEYSYDAAGNLSQLRLPGGEITRFEYDANDRLVSSTDALGAVTQMEYDGAGRLLRVVAANGGVTAFAYDTYGRQITETRPDGSIIRTTYRTDNRVATRVDPRGITITYSYDNRGLLTRAVSGGEVHDFAYNARGEMSGATNADATLGWQYDAVGRITQLTAGGRVIALTYNTESEVEQATIAGETLGYGYDARGLLEELEANAGTFRFEWDASGRLIAQRYPAGQAIEWQHDAADQLTTIDASTLSGLRYNYAFDSNGRIERLSGDGADWLYDYDAQSRLTQAAHGSDSFGYSYDALGNRLNDGASFDGFNKLLADTNNRYQYDAAGNRTEWTDLTTGRTIRYQYNAFGRLVSAAVYATAEAPTPETTVTMAYDPLGRRVRKTINGDRIDFEWLGSMLVAEYGGGNLLRRYTYGATGYAPVAVTQQGQTQLVVTDHLGTPRQLVTPSGTPVWQAAYEPFGKASITDGATSEMPMRFPGQYDDAELGMHYNFFRDYDPQSGRYVQSDPIGFAGGPNTYAYVNGNPIMGFDSLGLETCLLTTVGPGGIRDHAGVYTSRGDGSGGPAIYDPAGSYSAANGGGSGDVVTGDAADTAKYKNYHRGQDVELTCKETSQEEEENIINNALDLPSAPPFQCAARSSSALSGQPSFPNVKAGTFFPGNLKRQVESGR